MGTIIGHMRVLLVTSLVVVLAEITPLAQAPAPLLRDQDCGTKPTPIMLLAGVSVYVSCETVGTEREVQFVVEDTGDRDDRKITSFSIGFCAGPFASIHSPAGWDGQVRSGNRLEWAVRSDDRSAAISQGTKLDGFSATMKPGWVLSGSFSVGWVSDAHGGGAGSGAATHHCPSLLFR